MPPNLRRRRTVVARQQAKTAAASAAHPDLWRYLSYLGHGPDCPPLAEPDKVRLA